MTIRRLYGGSEHVGDGTWELFILENPSDEENQRWWAAQDALFPPEISGLGLGPESEHGDRPSTWVPFS